VILLGLFVFAVALVSMSARMLGPREPERASQSESGKHSAWLDAALFLMLLIGIVRAHRKRQEDED
jgi:hypothetical protein